MKVAYGEIVSEQLHDEGTVLVRVIVNCVQVSNRIVERLQARSSEVRGLMKARTIESQGHVVQSGQSIYTRLRIKVSMQI